MIRRRLSVALASLALGASAVVGGAVAANATEYPEGGTWNYGVDYGYMSVWSNYHHGSRAHGSTACSNISCTRSDRAAAGRYSYADRTATWGGNTAYYSF